MNHHYDDIRSRINEPPTWWDEHAVPRYCEFTPDEVANIYADEVALVNIQCQNCNHPFLVAFSWDRIDWVRGVAKINEPMTPERIQEIHYGDPPNYGCCAAGPTMNCIDVRVIQFWRRHHQEYVNDGRVTDTIKYFEWRRVPELEVVIAA